MSVPDLRLWVGQPVLAVRNATYFPAVILEVSNPSQCVMVEFKNFHGLVTMYEDVFNRGDLSIISDVCPKYTDVKVGLRVAIKSWSYETNQIFYIPGFVCAVLDDCGRLLVRNCYDMERIVGIEDIRIILPFWWKYAYYHFQAQAKQNYVPQTMLPQLQPQTNQTSQLQMEAQRKPSQKQQPKQQQPTPPPPLPKQQSHTPQPPPLPRQQPYQPQPILPPFQNVFHQSYYPWEHVLPRLPPPYPGEVYQPVNSYINSQMNVEKENLNAKTKYQEILPKANDYNNYNYGSNEIYPELLNNNYQNSSLIRSNNNQVSDTVKESDVNSNFNNPAFTNDNGNYSVKAKTVEVPVIAKELEIPNVVKVPEIPVASRVPELHAAPQRKVLPAVTKAQVLQPAASQEQTSPVPSKRQLIPILPKPSTTATKTNPQTNEPLVPNLQGVTKPQPQKRKYAKRKKPEDENTLRRPMNAFMYYSQEHRNALLLQNNQGFDNRHVSKILAQNWYHLPPAEKLKYNIKAAKAKEDQARADPEGLSWKRKNIKNKIQKFSECEISQIDAKVSSSDDEPRLVIDESRINEESDDNSSPLFVPKSSNGSTLEALLRGNPQLPDCEKPKNNNKENILETNNSNKVPTLPPELDNCLPESFYDTAMENYNKIKTESCSLSNLFTFNGGTMKEKIEKPITKEKTLIGEKFFPPDFSIDAVQKTEAPDMNVLTEAVIKEILISDAYYNNNGHYTKPQKKRLVVLNMFKENGYYPSDWCIEEVMQKHKDLFGNKNGLKTKIREVRQKLLSKIKNGTVPVSPMLKDMIASMIPDGDSPLTTPGSD